MSKRIRRTPEEARALILRAARERLSRTGPEGLRLQDIAADAGISHPSILHHFGNREGLVRALTREAAEELRHRDRRCPEFARPIAVVVELLRQIGQIVRAHPGRRPKAERVAQPVRDERKPDADAQQQLGPGREHLVHAPQGGNDKRRRPGHVASFIL